jgi:hypothetical protein
MSEPLHPMTLAQWDRRYRELCDAGLREPQYGGPLRRRVDDGDVRLTQLRMDGSAASLRLWNFLLSEEQRLHEAASRGVKLVGTMKDLGTIPVMAFALQNVVAFYPDGAWWLPCVMQRNTDALALADRLGIDDSFCPVRAMLGAFAGGGHFPIPGLLTCSVGATCDDFSAIAQRVEQLGHPIVWWEMPHRRTPDPGERSVGLPGGLTAPASSVAIVREELDRVRQALERYSGQSLDDARLAAGIRRANGVRRLLAELRRLVYRTEPCPLPALEMQIAEMMAIHFCSDRVEVVSVLEELLAEVQRRIGEKVGVLPGGEPRVYWVNPVADLRAMNLIEESGLRLCGADYMFCHALEPIPEDLPPMEALARIALADPMVGSACDRAALVCREARQNGAEAVVLSRIPGASHCGLEGTLLADEVSRRLGIPVVEIEVPPVLDAMEPTLRTRLEALAELVLARRRGDFAAVAAGQTGLTAPPDAAGLLHDAPGSGRTSVGACRRETARLRPSEDSK